MNFIEGVVVKDGVDCGDFVLKMPTNLESGKQVVLGLRPENITDQDHSFSKDTQIEQVRLELIEPTGADTLVTFRVNKAAVIARTHPRANANVNEPFRLSFDMSKALLFDKETGERV
jgi:multiple sugar transport system ATP-binding protein